MYIRPHSIRKMTLAACLAVAALALSACSSSSSSTASSGAQEITLGASVEVTGPAAGVGVPWQNGIQLAVKVANGTDGFMVGGKLYRWKLDLKDNQAKPDQAIANYQAFIGEKANFILGPGLSSAFPPAFNSLGGATPIVMTPSAAAAQFIGKDSGKNLFITHLADPGPDGRVARTVKVIQQKFSAKRVAILLPQDDAGQLYTKAFTDAFTASGAQVVYSKAFPKDTLDFSSFITGLKASTPDLIVSGYLDSWMKPFLDQAVAAGVKDVVVIGAPGSNVASAAGHEAAIKAYIWSVSTRAVDNAADPQVQAFRNEYQAMFGSAPGAGAFWGLSYYDPILMLTKAMQDAGSVTDLTKIRASLIKVTSWPNSAMVEHFDATTQQAIYNPQIGIDQGGAITYVEAAK